MLRKKNKAHLKKRKSKDLKSNMFSRTIENNGESNCCKGTLKSPCTGNGNENCCIR